MIGGSNTKRSSLKIKQAPRQVNIFPKKPYHTSLTGSQVRFWSFSRNSTFRMDFYMSLGSHITEDIHMHILHSWWLNCFLCFLEIFLIKTSPQIIWLTVSIQETYWFTGVWFFPTTSKIQQRYNSLVMYAKFSERLTFLTPWYVHVRVRIRG